MSAVEQILAAMHAAGLDHASEMVAGRKLKATGLGE